MLSRHGSRRWEFPAHGTSWRADPLVPECSWIPDCNKGITKSFFSTCQQDQYSSPTFALPSGNGSPAALNGPLHVAKEENPWVFFPAKAYPAASHSPTPRCNSGHPCQPHTTPRSIPETGKGWAAAAEVSPENSRFTGGLHSGTKSYEKYE